mgnify:CR=1 FL=1
MINSFQMRQEGYTAAQLRTKFKTFQSEYGKVKGGWKREFPQQIKLPGMNFTSKGRGVDYKCLNELLAMVAWNKFIQSGPEEWKDQLLPVATDEDDLTDLFREDFIQDGLDDDLQKYLGMQMWIHSTYHKESNLYTGLTSWRDLLFERYGEGKRVQTGGS